MPGTGQDILDQIAEAYGLTELKRPIVVISDREREVIECMFAEWVNGSMSLYGHLSFQDVFDLMDRLGIDKTPGTEKLEEIERRYSEIPRESETGIQHPVEGGSVD